MKRILLCGVCPFLLLTACNKQNTGNNIINNSWTHSGQSYTSGSTQVSTLYKTVTATNGTASLIFSFHDLPTTDGMYHVVAGTSVHAGEIGITAAPTPADTFRATGKDNIQAKVSILDEKIIIQLPSTWLKNIKKSSDSLSTTAYITETGRKE